jgi:hypothetical protein
LLSGVNDVVGRGAISGLLGTPGDLAGLAENSVRGIIGKPQVQPWGGSEHIGQTLEQAGLVSDVRRPKTELAASLISPIAVAKTVLNAPKMAMTALRLMNNLDSAPTMARIGQRGAMDVGLLSNVAAPQNETLRVAQTVGDMVQPQKLKRADIVQKAKALGLPTYGKNEQILERVKILESDPATWTADDFSKVADYLDIHQDFRGGSANPKGLESILSEGLRSGMSDNLGAMYSNKYYTYGKGLSGGRSFIFPSASIKYKSKTNPSFAPGNKPLFYFDAEKGQNIYEAMKSAKRNPNFGK